MKPGLRFAAVVLAIFMAIIVVLLFTMNVVGPVSTIGL